MSGGRGTTGTGMCFLRSNDLFRENLKHSTVPTKGSISLASDESEFEMLGSENSLLYFQFRNFYVNLPLVLSVSSSIVGVECVEGKVKEPSCGTLGG